MLLFVVLFWGFLGGLLLLLTCCFVVGFLEEGGHNIIATRYVIEKKRIDLAI